jgi:hypothetical protein
MEQDKCLGCGGCLLYIHNDLNPDLVIDWCVICEGEPKTVLGFGPTLAELPPEFFSDHNPEFQIMEEIEHRPSPCPCCEGMLDQPMCVGDTCPHCGYVEGIDSNPHQIRENLNHLRRVSRRQNGKSLDLNRRRLRKLKQDPFIHQAMLMQGT